MNLAHMFNVCILSCASAASGLSHVPVQSMGKVVTQIADVFDDVNDIRGEVFAQNGSDQNHMPSPEDHQNYVSNFAEAVEERKRRAGKVAQQDSKHAELANSLGTPSV